MRILSLSYEYPPLGGGGSRVVDGLTRSLVGLGCRVDLVTMGSAGLPAGESIDGVRIRRVPCVRLRHEVCTVSEMVTYDRAALRELPSDARVRDWSIEIVGDAGLIVPAADPQRRAQLGASGRDRLERRFIWRAVAARCARLYEDHVRHR